MLPRADNTGTRPLVAVEAPTPVSAGTDARQEIFHRLSQIALGSKLQAQVLSRLGDGTFLVKIADTTARMNLPTGTRVADTLSMTMLTATPRPTFLLGAEPGSATTTLSTAGRMIDSLLQNARQQGASTALTGKTPLATAAAVLLSTQGVSQVAAALQESIESSGLFYESHLQEWASSSRSLDNLLQEPQAQFSQEAMRAPAPRPGTGPQDLAQLAIQLRDLASDALPPVSPSSLIDADAIAANFKPAEISPEATQLINLQLQALEQKQVRWQGELFPGQPLEWEITEDTPQRNADTDTAPSSWQSTVRFELPTMGAISATLHLVDGRVHLQIKTASEASANALTAHGGELADALGAAGSPLDSLLIRQDEKN